MLSVQAFLVFVCFFLSFVVVVCFGFFGVLDCGVFCFVLLFALL